MNRQVVAVTVLAVSTAVLLVAASQDGLADRFDDEGEAAVIQLAGPISSTPSSGLGSVQGITPGQVRNLNERALDDDPDAIIYEINSGGGAVVASKDVRREMEKVDVPTVCRFQDISASGGYLAALGCDSIVADSGSLTGSIGVTSSYFQVSGLLDRLGVEYVNISSGEFKEIGSPYSNLTEEEERKLQEKANMIHDEFVESVDENRNLTDEQLEVVRTGEPFLGSEAEELGLVDDLGGRDTAVENAEQLTGKNLTIREVSRPSGFNIASLLIGDVGLGNMFSSSPPLTATY